MALGDAGKHLASAAMELAKSVAAAGDAVADAAQEAGGLVSRKAKEQALKAQAAKRERQLEKLNPVFRDAYLASDFDLPQIVVIEDEDQRKGEELCEGRWAGSPRLMTAPRSSISTTSSWKKSGGGVPPDGQA